jgi:Nuclease-related domain
VDAREPDPYWVALGPRPVEVAWTDLSLNAPGQLARREAVARRREAPVRTRVARVLAVHTEERAWRVGADGEEEVARRLGKLGDGWHVLHAVPVGDRGADIDHVVIGPGGVFTLNTKNHRGKRVWTAQRSLLVDGQRTDYLRNSRYEATRAARLLSSAVGVNVLVEPVIVVLAEKLTVKHQPDGVHVVAHYNIAYWLSRLQKRLAPHAVAAIFDVARRDTTWRADLRHG